MYLASESERINNSSVSTVTKGLPAQHKQTLAVKKMVSGAWRSAVIFSVFCVSLVSISFTTAAVVKRDVADSLGDQINEKFDELDDTKYCIEGSNCMDLIQWCDKRKFKVYGTCTYQLWFWIALAVCSLAMLSSLVSCICCCLCCKK